MVTWSASKESKIINTENYMKELISIMSSIE